MVALLFALLAGILGGVMAHKFIKFGIVLTSLLSSFCVGFLLYGITIYLLPQFQHFFGILIVTLTLFFVQICCLLTKGRALIIFGTSSIGAYMFMRGLSVIFYPYPSEIMTYQKLYRVELIEFQWQFIMSLGIFLFWFMISITI